MKWLDREILPIRHRYNCQINDVVYPPPMGALGKLLLKLHHARHHVLTDGFRSSERAIEVPLAIDFISHYVKDEPIIELGCVLPYYILKKSNHIVYDLTDRHPQNIKRDIRTMSSADLKGNLVSISTVEHIGLSEYGIKEGDVSATDMLKSILANARKYFVTFPLGHNPELDKYVHEANDLDERYLTRTLEDPNDWAVVEKGNLTEDMKRYGTYLRANTVCVLMKI